MAKSSLSLIQLVSTKPYISVVTLLHMLTIALFTK